MRTPQSTLSGRDVQAYGQHLLARHLRLPDHGPKCTASTLYRLLLYAAAVTGTIARACRELRHAPSDQAVYNALEATLPDRLELQRRLNRALAASLPKSLRQGKAKRRYPVAIDIDLLPYYGRPDPDDDLVWRGQRKASTHCHHAYATAYLVRKGRRFTLAVRAVRHTDPLDEVVRALLRQARRAVPGGLGLVLLDASFWGVDVIRYLQRARVPFIVPAVHRGRKASHRDGPSGINAFLTWKKSGWGRHQLRRHDNTGRARVDIAVKVRRQPPKRPGAKKRPPRVLVYGCWGVRGRDPEWVDAVYQARRVEWVRQTYRKRFGIETSYRQANQGRAWTTSRCPVRRLLLMGLALLLRNVWALLHLVALAERRRGGPRLRPWLLTLPVLLGWLARAVEALLGVWDRLELERPFTL